MLVVNSQLDDIFNDTLNVVSIDEFLETYIDNECDRNRIKKLIFSLLSPVQHESLFVKSNFVSGRTPPWIAGGFLRRIVMGENIDDIIKNADIDVFILSKRSDIFEAYLKYLSSTADIEFETVAIRNEVVDEIVHKTTHVIQKGELDLTKWRSQYQYQLSKLKLKFNDDSEFNGNFNNININIIDYLNNYNHHGVQNLFDTFDLTCNCIATDGFKVFFKNETIKDIKLRNLVFCRNSNYNSIGLKYSLCNRSIFAVMKRIEKFINMGYKLSEEQYYIYGQILAAAQEPRSYEEYLKTIYKIPNSTNTHG